MFIGVATDLAERIPTSVGGGGGYKPKGTTLQEVANEQKGSSWKNCYC